MVFARRDAINANEPCPFFALTSFLLPMCTNTSFKYERSQPGGCFQ